MVLDLTPCSFWRQATDQTFAAKLRQNLVKNPHFGYDKKSPTGDFLVDHYAGDVVYNCTKFLDEVRCRSGSAALIVLTAIYSTQAATRSFSRNRVRPPILRK